MRRSVRFMLEKSPAVLRQHLTEITSIADSEKEALGFLPHSAFEDAIDQKRLVVMFAQKTDGQCNVAGYILFGGVYPHSRVQQIAVKSEWRRHGLASALLASLISDLERIGFLSVKANVASDLAHANAFYGKHGFEVVAARSGGSARNRTILVRSRELDTEHLFSTATSEEIDLGQPKRFGHEAPFYTFDLNVLFDLVKNRNRYKSACALFGAALKQRIRLGVASEFISELRRTTTEPHNDPILQMALQLPRLPPPVDRGLLDGLADEVHRIVFVERNAARIGSTQSRSDAVHIAHSALSRVTAFITSDKAILAARNDLLAKCGIDVASLDELIALLPDELQQFDGGPQSGYGFECKTPSAGEAREYFTKSGVPESLAIEFLEGGLPHAGAWQLAIYQGGRIVAIACLTMSRTIEGESRLLIHVEPGDLERELYADYLLDAAIRQVCSAGPGTIRLLHLAGQSMVKSLAKSRGFVPAEPGRDLVKVAIGHPLTDANWEKARHQIRLRTGISLPESFSETFATARSLTVVNRSGKTFEITWERLEDLFSPTVILWPGREGVIVPIQRSYADELLGTNVQTHLSFIERRDAAFLSRRAYVNTPRARATMRPGLPILFYESGKKGGRRAIVAAGRIVDSVLVAKNHAPDGETRRVVVDDIAAFSATDDVLLTTFDNLMVFPTPVPLAALRQFNAVGPTNFISATPLSQDQIARIFEAGWVCGQA